MAKLQQLSGRDFDHEFIRVMVEDHQKDIAEFKKEAGEGHGPVEQLAAQTLPTLEKHLQMAQSLSAQRCKARAGHAPRRSTRRPQIPAYHS